MGGFVSELFSRRSTHPHRLFAGCALLMLASGGMPLLGLYVIPQTKKVPVARLVENLEKARAADPNNIEIRINLARLHGMAFALKTEEIDAVRWSERRNEEPYYGLSKERIPYKPVTAKTTEAEAAARRHLQASLSHYKAALDLDPRNVAARLGYAWSLQQSGERAEAIARYRQLIRDVWPTEERTLRMFPEDRYITEEAAGYLISLLDPERDAAEIADLQEKRKYLEGRPARAITPVVIPLEDDAPQEAMAAPYAHVRFDADGSGLVRSWSWISPKAGWLVHDPERGGRITSALQWFGNVTFWLFWENGYHALRALDDDANGELTGDELRDLAIWHDRDSDGISDPGEVGPLSAYRVVALSCQYEQGDGVRFAAVSRRGVRLANGRTRPSYDVLLRPTDVRTLTRR